MNLSENLVGLALGMIVFFACGTALSTVLSADASRLGAKVFDRYAIANDMEIAFGPCIAWERLSFSDLLISCFSMKQTYMQLECF